MSGNHRLTAILCTNTKGGRSAQVEQNASINTLVQWLKVQWQPPTEFTHQPISRMIALFDEFARRLAPAFASRKTTVEQFYYSGFITGQHILFATEEDVEDANLCVPPQQIEAFLQGEPVFLAPLRLFEDEKNRKGPPPVREYELLARRFLAIATYRYKHFLTGAKSNELNAAGDADKVVGEQLGDILANFATRRRVEGRPDAFAEYMKIAGETIRANRQIPAETAMLAYGRELHELGRLNADRIDDPDGPIEQAARDLQTMGVLLERAAILATEVINFNNSPRKFGLPIAELSRFRFADPANPLLEVLLSPPTDRDIDVWSFFAMETGINPARFWPSAWPLFAHFNGAIAVGKARYHASLDGVSMSEIAGLETILNELGPTGTAIAQSRQFLRALVPAARVR